MKEQNAKELALAAHSLKSASASVGAMAVSHYCFKLEMMGKGGNVASAADDLFRCLNDSFKAAQVELEKQK